MPKYAEEILAAVTELQQHPSAEQVFLEMKREFPIVKDTTPNITNSRLNNIP